jgi:hypothetical protein
MEFGFMVALHRKEALLACLFLACCGDCRARVQAGNGRHPPCLSNHDVEVVSCDNGSNSIPQTLRSGVLVL